MYSYKPESVPQFGGGPLLLLDGADVAALVHRPPPLVQLTRVVQGLQDFAEKQMGFLESQSFGIYVKRKW